MAWWEEEQSEPVPYRFDWEREMRVYNLARNVGVAGLKGSIGFVDSLGGAFSALGDKFLGFQDESMRGTRVLRDKWSSLRERNFEPAQRELRSWYTPGVSQQSSAVNNAFDRGFLEGMRAAARNPAGALVNSGESLVVPGVAGKGGKWIGAGIEGLSAFGEGENLSEGAINALASVGASLLTGRLGKNVAPGIKGFARTTAEEATETIPIGVFNEYVVPYSFELGSNVFGVQRAEAHEP